ncbi:MAG: hypothetical protein ACRESR_10180 [Gammaproteobacteria bacterium]
MNTTPPAEGVPESIRITDNALRALEKTRGWVRFLGIVSVVIACLFGLVFLTGLGVLAAVGMVGILPVIEGAVVVAIAVLYAVYWLKYSRALKRLSETDGNLEEALEDAFVRQRRLWTFQGVLFIVLIGLAILSAIVLPLFVNYQALSPTPM